MHVLVTNDDGPPGAESPFIRGFVETLAALTDWRLTVVVPDTQKSWIGKAFHIREEVRLSHYDPELHCAAETTSAFDNLREEEQQQQQHFRQSSSSPSSNSAPPAPATASSASSSASTSSSSPSKREEKEPSAPRVRWMLLTGTPATCVNIGLHHLTEFMDVDLVISGPNFGRNSGSAFTLSSGTVGGAMEAALSGKRAIAISYAFSHFSDVKDAKRVEFSHLASVAVVAQIWQKWQNHVQSSEGASSRVSPLSSTPSTATSISMSIPTSNSESHEPHTSPPPLSAYTPLASLAASLHLPESLTSASFSTTHIFNINVPIVRHELVERNQMPEVHLTTTQHSRYGSLFKRIEIAENTGSTEVAPALSNAASLDGDANSDLPCSRRTVFRFAPTREAMGFGITPDEGTDQWAIDRGFVSITPMRALFEEAKLT